MTDTSQHRPDDLALEIRELDRRLRALETAPRITSTSIREGTFKVLDSSGTVRAEIGRLADGVNYGVRILDDAGDTRFQADGRGVSEPFLSALVVASSAAAVSVSSGSYVPAWQLYLPEVAHRGVEVQIPWRIVGTGFFNVQLGASAPLSGSADAALVGGPASGTIIYRWRHGQTLGTSPFGLAVTARRFGGSGAIDLFTPTAWGRTEEGCTAGGLISVI